MEGIVVILGLCITFVPIIMFCDYVLKRVYKKSKFDEHLEIVSKKGIVGKIVAYLERILFGITVSSFGFLMSEVFINEGALIVFVISLVMYIIVKYFDEKNEK